MRYAHRRDTLLVIVFSKDRPLQIDLLLRTLKKYLTPPPEIHVLYRASNQAFQEAYGTVFAENAGLKINPKKEDSFRENLLEICKKSNSASVMFLVDDIVFIREINVKEITVLARNGYIVSTRLGLNITCAQTAGMAERALPVLTAIRGTKSLFFSWVWAKANSGYWSLPTALDGNVLPLNELIPVLEATSFKAPNSLEAAIGQYRFLFKYSAGACYESPRIVNLPLNTVKSEDFNFPHMGICQNEMLETYKNGGRLDAEKFPHSQHNSCHMEWVPEVKKP